MNDVKQGAAEWLRGIARAEYDDDGDSACVEIHRRLGVECFDVGRCRECAARSLENIADRIDAERALPGGMEWPRFEDGGLVRIGDEVEFDGETMLVCDVTFYADSWTLWCDCENISGRIYGSYGERVKRPAPKVLDADGVPIEVGDTVWAVYGEHRKHTVRTVCSDGSLKPNLLVDDGCMVAYEDGGWDFAVRVSHEPPDSWVKWGEDLDMAVKAGEVDKVEMMRRAKALVKAAQLSEEAGVPYRKSDGEENQYGRA